MPQIETDCSFAKQNAQKALGFGRLVALVLPGHIAISETVLSSVTEGIKNCFRETVEPCLDRENAEQMREAVSFARQAQLLGGSSDEFNPFNPDYACEEMIAGSLQYLHELETVVVRSDGSTVETVSTETMNIDVKTETDITGGLVDAGTTFSYTKSGTTTTSCETAESTITSGGSPGHLRLGIADNRMHFDIGGFVATGTGTSENFCNGQTSTVPVSLSFREILTDAGCDPLDPTQAPGLLFSSPIDGNSADFTCSATVTRVIPDPSGRPGSNTTTHTVTVSGVLSRVAVPEAAP